MALTFRTDGHGVPLGSFFITGGPGKYEFLIEGLLQESDLRVLRFHLKIPEGCVPWVPVRVTGAKKVSSSACPPFPAEISGGPKDHDLVWEEAWEFAGFVPGHGVPVRGIYSPVSRKGVAFLWQAHADDYGCPGCRRDLLRFFSDPDERTGLLALERAMVHMFSGSYLGELYNRCEECLTLFRELRQSCDLP